MYDDILVPTDGRENTELAIEEAIELASIHDAGLHTLYVINSAAVAPGIDFDDLEAIGRDAVEYVADLAAERGLTDVETTVTHGLRHRAILQYADDHDVDLIVMGRHTGLERLFRHSVSDRVEAEASVPVLVVE
ncbi:universal stress protein [Natrialbaceae archaeon AArc-T1-2]|uniref:universal stress protein n=1 Tax=Natrialbaceae archaeon AArc-T1-2 TaxID=3053904 RepID=UPI00255A8BC1|nr:universal stress protein [Natrialbaceae archaeon AArc-T1-2]WIV68132.1 universal stress protein [Natrialbaceae archaeon AArc-T1-2]